LAELSGLAPLATAKNPPVRSGRRLRQRKGEAQQATAAGLDLLRVLGWLVLHDVAVPGDDTRAIDHVLVGPAGVYVVDTVTWSGAVTVTESVLVVGGTDRADDLAAVIAAADAVRGLLGGVPVVPMLCFERLEPIAGVVADVALCASENILDVLTSQPALLDTRAIGQASRTLASGIAALPQPPRTVIPEALQPIDLPPAVDDHVAGEVVPIETFERLMGATTAPAPPAPPVPAGPEVVTPPEVVPIPDPDDGRKSRLWGRRGSRRTAKTVEPADEVTVVMPEAPVEAVTDAAVEQVVVPDQPSDVVIHDAGAALWQELTGGQPAAQPAVAPPVVAAVPVDVDAAVLEAEIWEREVEEADARAVTEKQEREATEAREREAEDRAGREAREQKARAALRRVEEEARRLAEQEAREQAEAEALAKAEAEARAKAEAEAEARAQAEAEARAQAEQEAREQAEAEARAQAEAEARAQAEAEARAKAEAEARAKAEQEAREKAEAEARAKAEAEAREKAEQEAREKAEAEARAKAEAEAEARAKAEQEAREQAEAEARAKAEQEAREQAEAEARAQAEQEAQEQAEAEAREQAARERAEQEALTVAAVEVEVESVEDVEDVEVVSDQPDVFDRDAADRAADLAAIREREAERARRRAERKDSKASRRPAPATAPVERVEPPELARVDRSRPDRLAKLVRTARAATSDPLEEDSGRRLPRRALIQVAIAAVVIAVVTVAAPHLSSAVSWGQQLFAKDAPTTVGTAVTVEANQLHPAAELLAGAPVPAQATAGKVAKGQRLIAVPIRLTNQGLERWDVPIASRLSLVDTLGLTHQVTRSVTGIKGRPLLGAKLRLAPGKSVTGYVVFSVPNGRTIRSIKLGLSDSAGDAVTWQVGS
jgi:hypothetical protein